MVLCSFPFSPSKLYIFFAYANKHDCSALSAALIIITATLLLTSAGNDVNNCPIPYGLQLAQYRLFFSSFLFSAKCKNNSGRKRDTAAINRSLPLYYTLTLSPWRKRNKQQVCSMRILTLISIRKIL